MFVNGKGHSRFDSRDLGAEGKGVGLQKRVVAGRERKALKSQQEKV